MFDQSVKDKHDVSLLSSVLALKRKKMNGKNTYDNIKWGTAYATRLPIYKMTSFVGARALS